MKTLFRLLVLIFVFALTSCFEQLDNAKTEPSIIKYITAADFTGATSAVNLTTGIQVNWGAVANGKTVIAYHIYKYKSNIPLLIASVSPANTSYIDGDVVSGSKYQYLVKAVDPSNTEDDNTATVATLAWSGLTTVTSSELDKITVNFDNTLQGVLIRLYLQRGTGTRAAVKDLSTLTDLEAGTYVITAEADGTPLRAGAQYTVTASIFETGSNTPDGNTKLYQVSTLTYGYDGVTGIGPGWNSVATVRAFGRAPNAQGVTDPLDPTDTVPSFVPTVAQVQIGFLPFTLPNSLAPTSYKYVVFRFGEGKSIDTSDATLQSCPSSYNDDTATGSNIPSSQPCIVKTDIDPTTDLINGLYRVTDTKVWYTAGVSTTARPARYRYTMALKHLVASGTSYVEPMPMASVNEFSVDVPIPPDYMVLVNRETANFEFCTAQRSTRSDPLNFNRCPNLEVGSEPYNSGPGKAPLFLTAGYYDFGYNLFVDRYPVACNADDVDDSHAFSTASPPSTTYGTGISTAYDDNPDRVLYSLSGTGTGGLSNCSYRTATAANGGSWLAPNQFDSSLGILADTAYQRAFTSQPDNAQAKFKFSYPYWTSQIAQRVCENMSVNGYGAKRIPRLREYRSFSAPPMLNARFVNSNISDFYATQITNATSNVTTEAWSTGACVIGAATGLTTPFATGQLLTLSSNTGLFEFSTSGNSGPKGFAIGSAGDAACMSKYGISDVLETTSTNTTWFTLNGYKTSWYPVSDYFLNSGTTYVKGLLSPLDSGNYDVSYSIDGTQTGYNLETAGTTVWNISTAALLRIDQSLGIPVISSLQGQSSYSPKITANQNYGQDNLARFPASGVSANYARANARYSLSLDNGNSYLSRVRCVIPAD